MKKTYSAHVKHFWKFKGQRSNSKGDQVRAKVQFRSNNWFIVPVSNFCLLKALIGAVFSVSENLMFKGSKVSSPYNQLTVCILKKKSIRAICKTRYNKNTVFSKLGIPELYSWQGATFMYKFSLGKFPLSLKHLLQNLEMLMPVTPEIWKPFSYLGTKIKRYIKVNHTDTPVHFHHSLVTFVATGGQLCFLLCALYRAEFSTNLLQIHTKY